MTRSTGNRDDGSASADLRDPAARLTGAITQIDQLQAELADLRRAYSTAFGALAESEERLARVEALCDLAEWARRVNGDAGIDGPLIVRVDDVRRALYGSSAG